MSSDRDAAQLGVVVGLGEVAGHDARAEPPGAVVVDRLAGEQAQEVALAGAVRAEHRDAARRSDLDVERVGEAVELELLADDHARAGAVAAEPHRHLLVADPLGRRRRLEPLDLRLRGAHAGREHVAAHRRARRRYSRSDSSQPLALLLPAAVVLVDAGDARPRAPRARWRTTAVHPRGAALERDDLVRDRGEQRAVVADQEDRLRARAQRLLEPLLARRRRGSCRARRGAARRRPSAAAPRARGASARRRTASTAGGPPAASSGWRTAIVVHVSQSTSASQPPASPQAVWARASASRVRSPGARAAASAAANAGRARWTRGGERARSMSRTVRPSSRQPTSWRITRSRRRRGRCPVDRHVAGDHPEQRGLARAVRAHQRDVLAVAARNVTSGRASRRRGCDTRSR